MANYGSLLVTAFYLHCQFHYCHRKCMQPQTENMNFVNNELKIGEVKKI